MTNYNWEIKNWPRKQWPKGLLEIPEPPKQMNIIGNWPADLIKLCIVGPRKYTDYGEQVCRKLISALSGYPIAIVSGLAHGIDRIAHESAIENNMISIAAPGSGLSRDFIYPRFNLGLAEKVLDNGGCLISEFPNDFGATRWTLPKRNRIMVGISKAILIIEANKKSGTMITARLSTDYNRDLLVVPGSIFNENSDGPNRLLHDGATPITCPNDLLEALGFDISEEATQKIALENLTATERYVYEIVKNEISLDDLVEQNIAPVEELNKILTTLEIYDLITITGNKICQK